jgi:hypothetical protein
MQEVDANKVIQDLASKIGTLEVQNSILQAQLAANESGDENGKQDTKS